MVKPNLLATPVQCDSTVRATVGEVLLSVNETPASVRGRVRTGSRDDSLSVTTVVSFIVKGHEKSDLLRASNDPRREERGEEDVSREDDEVRGRDISED